MPRLRRRINPTTYGTSYFVSMSAAVSYYKDYGDEKEDVQRKIREGSIHIGKPPLKPGERLGLTDGGKRYTITEAQKIPNGRLVPARIKHNGKTYAGKVKRVNGKVKIFVTPEVARKINPRQIHEYLVILHNKNAVKGHTMTITASTAGNASREAKRRKKSMADARNWKVFSVKRLS